jgi:hypothetical protein
MLTYPIHVARASLTHRSAGDEDDRGEHDTRWPVPPLSKHSLPTRDHAPAGTRRRPRGDTSSAGINHGGARGVFLNL